LPLQRHVINPRHPRATSVVLGISERTPDRSSVSGPIGTPAIFARRAPPSPPACSADVVSSSVVALVRWVACRGDVGQRCATLTAERKQAPPRARSA
jgi:hypothetical protein